MQIDYATLENELLDFLDAHKTLVLATSLDGRVTARSMSIVRMGLKVCCQMSRDSTKYAQIAGNPQVALCAANLQLEGTARFLGHPLDAACADFLALLKQSHPGSFTTYSHLPGEVVLEITPRRAVFWKYDEAGQPLRDFLDLEARRAEREMYNLVG